MNKEKNQSQKSTKKKVLNIVTTVLLVLVIIFGVICSYTAFMSKQGNRPPEIFGLRIFSIQSDSMEPVFYEGDLVFDTAVDVKALEVGDIITFYTVIQGERVLNTHRITEITEMQTADGSYLYFTTKGDNAPDEDPLGVHQNEIVGKYAFAIPAMGSVIDFLQTSVGFGVVIVLPVFIFFIYNLVQFFRVFFDYKAKKMRMELKQQMREGKGLDDEDDDEE